MSVLDTIRGFFTNAEEPQPAAGEEARALDSGPVPSGPITITLNTNAEEPRWIRDLSLYISPGQPVDLGYYYTQKQINDSIDLKHAITRSIVTYELVGTDPSLEPISLDGATITAEVDLDPETDGVKVYGTDGVTNVQVLTDATGIVQVNPTALPPGAATEDTLINILETLGGQPASPFTVYGETSLSYNITGDILIYTVPAGMKFRMRGARGWADIDGEFFVKKNGTQVDGYRTTTANLTMDIDTEIHATAGDFITIGATHWIGGGAKDFKAVIFGVLEAI